MCSRLFSSLDFHIVLEFAWLCSCFAVDTSLRQNVFSRVFSVCFGFLLSSSESYACFLCASVFCGAVVCYFDLVAYSMSVSGRCYCVVSFCGL